MQTKLAHHSRQWCELLFWTGSSLATKASAIPGALLAGTVPAFFSPRGRLFHCPRLVWDRVCTATCIAYFSLPCHHLSWYHLIIKETSLISIFPPLLWLQGMFITFFSDYFIFCHKIPCRNFHGELTCWAVNAARKHSSSLRSNTNLFLIHRFRTQKGVWLVFGFSTQDNFSAFNTNLLISSHNGLKIRPQSLLIVRAKVSVGIPTWKPTCFAKYTATKEPLAGLL